MTLVEAPALWGRNRAATGASLLRSSGDKKFGSAWMIDTHNFGLLQAALVATLQCWMQPVGLLIGAPSQLTDYIDKTVMPVAGSDVLDPAVAGGIPYLDYP